jgi:ech hydrogenase subunit E
MAVRTIIPFGPQHPVLPEPIHLKLELEDERVVGVTPIIGYVHRGIEKAAELNTFRQNTNLFDRICGICSFIHGQTYCQGVEALMGVEAPPRAKFLRTFWSELSRTHSHLLWLGLLADCMGFESLFMQIWRAREIVQDLSEMTTGHRVIQASSVVGGVRRDIDKDMAKEVDKRLVALKEMLDNTAAPALLHDATIKRRAVGKGMLSKEQAELLGAVGPTARGSGVAKDIRQTGYAAFKEVGFEPVVETAGDSYARTLVRARETYQSIEIMRRALAMMPSGEILVRVDGYPEGETVSRCEQPRGEVFYYLKGNGTNHLERVKVRTPTFANIPTYLVMLPGCEMADVPVITLSIDPCIGCTER